MKVDAFPKRKDLAHAKLTAYEKRQNFNVVTSYLHSHRYRYIIKVFKEVAKVVTDRPIRVLDIGCANSKLFSVLNPLFSIDYKGIDLNQEKLLAAEERYGSCSNFGVTHGSALDLVNTGETVDVVVALETLEHIPENDVVRLVERVSSLKPLLFCCSVPVEIGPSIWIKNFGSSLMGYQRTKYTPLQTFWAGLYKLDKLPRHGSTHRGFNWLWLAQTIRYNFKIRKIKTLPFGCLPAWLAPTVFFVAEPWN